MRELRVDLGDRSYPIFIQSGLLANTDLLASYLSKQILIVTNETVAPLYGEGLRVALATRSDLTVELLALPDGESYKNLDTLSLIFDRLLELRFNRNATLLALGGGVVGDMCGFAAACYQRGVNFVQVPTTVLSQVDSSVGGKTGVNHPLGKNMIGAFYQPQAVLIDLDVLDSLPSRELSAGLAEVIKYGLIYDESFFEWLEVNMPKLIALDKTALEYAIEESCAIKARVVAQDEREGGLRAILNLGHTFGHAIEAHQGYGKWLHGEAVAVGMLMALDLSVRLGWIERAVLVRARALNEAANLPVDGPSNMSPDDYLGYMAVDKKVLDKKLRLVLLSELGKALVTEDFDHDKLLACLNSFCTEV
ncbi:3-dehydroquinate synthase [Agaribacterium sp. ZY112]|uniref:3-dehydroquinate synthase n=1 Tax=Agaribacterium sp. ZY112 TaxID=3233574 RepID=UPI0035240850